MSQDVALAADNPLVLAMNEVMKACSFIEETGKNNHFGYSYASDFDLLTTVQPAMANNGLTLVPEDIELLEQRPIGDRGRELTVIKVTYRLRHVSGATALIVAVGTGVDNEDKGAYKAQTGALKYALRQALLIPTGQDAERDVVEKKQEANLEVDLMRKYGLAIGDLDFLAELWGTDRDVAMARLGADPDPALADLRHVNEKFVKAFHASLGKHITKPAKKDYDDANDYDRALERYKRAKTSFLMKLFGVPSAKRVPADRGERFIGQARDPKWDEKFAKLWAKYGGQA